MDLNGSELAFLLYLGLFLAESWDSTDVWHIVFEGSPKHIFIMSSFGFHSVGISLDYSIISSKKKCVKPHANTSTRGDAVFGDGDKREVETAKKNNKAI